MNLTQNSIESLGLVPRRIAKDTTLRMYAQTEKRIKALEEFLNKGSTSGQFYVEDLLDTAVVLLADKIPDFRAFEETQQPRRNYNRRDLDKGSTSRRSCKKKTEATM